MHLAIGILATQLWKISVYRNIPSATFMEMRVLPLNNCNYVHKIALGWKRAIILSVSSWPWNKTRHRDTQSTLYRSHIMPEKEEPKSYTTNDLHCNSPALCVRVHWKLHAQSMDTEYQLGWVYWRWTWIHSRARVKPPPIWDLSYLIGNKNKKH